MNKDFTIRIANPGDYDAVGMLTWDLIHELSPEWTAERSKESFVETARSLLSAGSSFWAFVAEFNDEIIAILNINQCAAIYAGGAFGEITEFYIKPDFRSKGIGANLIDSAKSFSADKGWTLLEVGAPSPDGWQRTIDFYLKSGFSAIGPRLEISIPTSLK